MDLAEWLRGLGLEQYAPAFREHDIDADVVRRLTTEDLRELGVASIGHRRRLLDAIAALEEIRPAAAASKPEPEPDAPAAAPETESIADAAESRTAAQLIAESEGVSRPQALRLGVTPLVGRDREMKLLLRRSKQVKAGQGRVVLISGEPGIGKSRLAAELAARIAPEPHTRLRYFCSPLHQSSPLYPLILQLERAARFGRDDTPEQKRDKLATLLAPGAPGGDEMELIAELLSLPNSAADIDRSPQRKRDRLFEALLRQLDRLAKGQPLLVTFENAQWIDPTSRELLDLMIERVARLRVLLLVTFRPEFHPPWGGQSHVTSLVLNPLGTRESAALVENLTVDAALGADLVGQIVEHTDGVPLFVEELTKVVLETASQDDALAALLAANSASTIATPATLQASLMARLDRLGTGAREIAQIGAVAGREFTYELIRQVVRRQALDATLAQLTEAGFLFSRGAAPQSSYLFKHALVQDAVYDTLSHARRQELHARVAAALEQRFPELVERQPELLAHHFSAAGAPGRAIEYWFTAGERAKKRSADREAVAQLRAALRLTEELTDPFGRAAWELRISIALGPSLMTTTGSAAPEWCGFMHGRANWPKRAAAR